MTPTQAGSVARRAGTRVAAWWVGLGLVAAFLRLASRHLATPPLLSAIELAAWVDGQSEVATMLALVRLGAEVATWYVLVISALHGVARVFHRPTIRVIATALTPGRLRPLVQAGLGLGLVAATATAAPRLHLIEPAGASVGRTTSDVSTQPARRSGTASMRPVETPAPSGTATMRPVEPPASPGAASANTVDRTWTVSEGESLWTIAEESLSEQVGRPSCDAEVHRHWQRLIELNRARLVDPDNPDLIHPGQRLELPIAPACARP